MAVFTKNLIALRIARRSIKRNRLQSALIIAIIALPLALAGFTLTFTQSLTATGEELVHYQLGLAQAKYRVAGSPDKQGWQTPTGNTLYYTDYESQAQSKPWLAIEDVLPDVELLPITESTADFETATGIGSIQVVLGHSWNSAFLGQGPRSLAQGRVPTKVDEVVVTPDSLLRFAVSLGEQIKTVDGQAFTVVGVMADPSRGKLEDVVYLQQDALQNIVADASNTAYFQISGNAPSWSEIKKLNESGVVVASRSVLLNPPPASEIRGDVAPSLAKVFVVLMLTPIALMPVIVLAGSAFAFGARRQTRTLAILSSLGASRKMLRSVTLSSGIWLGLIGGVIGLSLGALSVWIFGPAIANASQGAGSWSNYPGFHLPLAMLMGALGASVLLGAATSLVPAIKASKVNVLATLRGSRTEGQVRARLGIGALLTLLLGTGSILASLLVLKYGESTEDYLSKALVQLIGVLLGIGGAIITIIAFMIGTGWLLRGLRAVMSRFGSTANFAGKDLLFNRKRYSPVIASVLTVTFVSSFIASFFYGPTKFNHDNYPYQYLPGQAGLVLPITPKNFDPNNAQLEPATLDDFWAGVPTRKFVNSQRNLILESDGFESATVIDSTVDVLNSMGTFSSDGTLAAQFDVPSPYVVFNPDAVCYATGLTAEGQQWLQSQDQGSSFQKTPEGCAYLQDPKRTIAVGDTKELRAILTGPNAGAERVLEQGGVVLFGHGYDYSGKAKVSWLKPTDYYWAAYHLDKATKTVTLPSFEISSITSTSFAYTAMVSRKTARELGITAYPNSVVANYQDSVPTAALDQLNARNVYLSLSNGTGIVDPEVFAWIVVLLAALFSLAATGIALGLSQIEARTDKRTLSAIGAPRSFRARLVSSQALALTLTGSIFGAGTGLMLGAAMLYGMDAAMANFPWLQLSALVIGVPLIAALGFWLLTPRSLKYETRQALD